MAQSEHLEFLAKALDELKKEERILGVAITGSWPNKEMDEFSDLDLVIVCDPVRHQALLKERKSIAERLGNYLVGFTGEHIGEPQLFISLYEEPLLHIDLNFLSLDDFPAKANRAVILWERKNDLSESMVGIRAESEQLNLQWIEDRFWVWIHYAAMRIGRGEILETMNMLNYIRAKVLGPLALKKCNRPPHGLRRFEQHCESELDSIRSTIADYDARSCERALLASAKMYVDLRENTAPPTLVRHRRAEMAVMQYLHRVRERV